MSGNFRPQGYNVHDLDARKSMLETIGLKTIDDLFSQIPAALKMSRPLRTPEAMSEWEIEKHFRTLAANNKSAKTHMCFLGGGFYEHHVPAAVEAIVNRGEFLTAYTPYQPEMSQGLLQSLFEYQQTVSKIIGLETVNSSSYDGATALSEATWMMVSASKTPKILVAGNIWPEYLAVLKTYSYGRDVEIVMAPVDAKTGEVSKIELQNLLKTGGFAGLVIQSPNCNGVIEDIETIAKLCKQQNALLTVSFNPWLSGLLNPPGSLGADIVACEGQVFGLPLSAGGPSLGILAVRKELKRFMPGRIIGRVADIYGKPAYAMVYEDREQHVAREKATSNLCSNQALCAIRSVIYLTMLGETGFTELAQLNFQKAHYLADKLSQLKGVALPYGKRFFNEFLLQLPCDVEPLLDFMEKKKGIFAGINGKQLGKPNHLLIAVTETKSQKDLDLFVEAMKEYLSA
jgi:glycine dehydrogenase subunit 1